jgi:TorA maturation chaperone TorD
MYDFLGALLARPAGADLIATCRDLDGDDSDLGRALKAIAAKAAEATPKSVEREYTDLFIGVGRGELVPYASVYLTGFLHEKPLAQLRSDMAALGIERSPEVYEPEDNIASLCEMMAGLILGRFGKPVPLARQREFFNRHLGPWAVHFFSDLEKAEHANFHAPVGTVGRLFMQIEKEAFRMAGDAAA